MNLIHFLASYTSLTIQYHTCTYVRVHLHAERYNIVVNRTTTTTTKKMRTVAKKPERDIPFLFFSFLLFLLLALFFLADINPRSESISPKGISPIVTRTALFRCPFQHPFALVPRLCISPFSLLFSLSFTLISLCLERLIQKWLRKFSSIAGWRLGCFHDSGFYHDSRYRSPKRQLEQTRCRFANLQISLKPSTRLVYILSSKYSYERAARKRKICIKFLYCLIIITAHFCAKYHYTPLSFVIVKRQIKS